MKIPLWIVLVASIGLMAGCGGGGGGGGSQAQAATAETTEIEVVTSFAMQDVSATDTDGVQSVSCPINSTAISAGCSCNIAEGAGEIFSLLKSGNGAVCACGIGSGGLSTAPLEVRSTCMSKIVSNAVSSVTIQKPAMSDLPDEATIAKWGEEIQAEEARLHEARNAQR